MSRHVRPLSSSWAGSGWFGAVVIRPHPWRRRVQLGDSRGRQPVGGQYRLHLSGSAVDRLVPGETGAGAIAGHVLDEQGDPAVEEAAAVTGLYRLDLLSLAGGPAIYRSRV